MARKTRTKEEEEHMFHDIITHNGNNVIDSLKIDVKAKTKNQKEFIKLIREKEIVICSGLPGTGKTFVSCAIALELLKSEPQFKKIVLVKSAQTLDGEGLGYLKGELESKLEPIMFSFINNFEKIIGVEKTTKLKLMKYILETPVAYMRGLSIDNAIVIADEIQNLSVPNLRTLLSRIGENSKMILLGDVNQSDNHKIKGKTGLDYVLKHFREIDEIGLIELGEEDVVRNPLIKKMENVFNTNPY